MRCAARASAWQSQGLTPLRIAFSVSPLQFLHADFSARVLSTAAQSGLDPRMLELIVTREYCHARPP